MRVAVTGSTGFLGGLVARTLAHQGIPLALLVRSAARAPQLPDARVLETAGYADLEANTTALRGVSVVFMVSAAESADRLEQHRAFVDAAAAAGVKHIVYLSFQNAAPDATFTLARTHWHTEQHIRNSGMEFTFLRDSFYQDFLTDLAGEDGVIRGPAGQGRVAAVTRADAAAVATRVLRDADAHRGKTYTLTGPQALSMDEVAHIMSEETGRAISFHNETIEEAYASRMAWDVPDWQREAWVSTYTAIASGELAEVTTSVLDITGQEPVSFSAFVRKESLPSPRLGF